MQFVADSMLGRLAKWLRILGYDVIYKNSFTTAEIIKLSEETNRIILTRDTKFIKNKNIKNFLFIKSDFLFEQLKQVIKGLNLKLESKNFFTRCAICNEKLEDIKKEEVKDKIPEYVYQTQEEFGICRTCKKIYWKATHYDKMLERIKEENLIDKFEKY